jgi:hypothetical protein
MIVCTKSTRIFIAFKKKMIVLNNDLNYKETGQFYEDQDNKQIEFT